MSARHKDNMSLDASPSKEAKMGVRTVNKLPMAIVAGIVTLALCLFGYLAFHEQEHQNDSSNAAEKNKAFTDVNYVQEILGNSEKGWIADKTVTAASAEAAPENALNDNGTSSLNAPPLPRKESSPLLEKSALSPEELARIRLAKLQMLDEAVRAKTTVPVVASRSSGSAPNSQDIQNKEEMLAKLAAARQKAENIQDATQSYHLRLAQLRSELSAKAGIETSSSMNAGKEYAQFEAKEEDRWALNSQTQAPRSAYELRAGFVLPAVLISGINSELPGQIMAQVSQNVYDTATGKYLLIPQGTRLVGAYSSDVVYGQSRVLIAWQRIVFPDGKALDLGAMPGADASGYAGFNDQVNNHYFRIFGSALLMSAVVGGITYSQQSNQTNPYAAPTANQALSEALGQQLGQVTAQMIAKNLNIAPTLEIRPGYRFNVIVTKDVTFSKPYKAFDY